MRIGLSEVIVIMIVALVVIGPDRLPDYARKLGEALSQFRKYSDEATRGIKNSVVEPLMEAQKPLKEAVEPLEEVDRKVHENLKEVEKSLADVGKVEKHDKKVGTEKEKSRPDVSHETAVTSVENLKEPQPDDAHWPDKNGDVLLATGGTKDPNREDFA